MNSPFVTCGKVFKPGDVIVHTWYKQFCLEDGNPDLVAITILSDIVAWYRNGTDGYSGALTPKLHGHSLYLSYNYYEQKFGFREDRVRRALTRLYTQNILKRRFKNIHVKGRRVNKLVIDLDAGFFKSCFLDPELDIRGIREEKKSYRLHRCYHQISTKTIFIKNRSSVHTHKSNFCKNSLAKQKTAPTTSLLPVKGFSLASFYPLSQLETAKLQALCGREFSGNAINEILLSMSKRLTDRFFKSKKAFMKYMAKALTYELRDAVKTSNDSFRIRANISNDEILKQQQEVFLSTIEESTDTTTAGQLSRKLASILAPDLAYEFLLAAKFPPHETSSALKINLQKSIDLSEMQYRLILEQAQSVYGPSINSLEFIVKNQESPGMNISNVILPDANNQKLLGVWGRIRMGLIRTCGEAIDRNWFSKLKVNVDEEKGEIKLQAPTLFIRDWIQQNYQHLLEKFSNQENYRLMEVGV